MSHAVPTAWPPLGDRPLLGANGTEALKALLAEGWRSAVDYLKVGPFQGREELVALAAQYPLLLHLDDTLSGHDPWPAATLATLDDWVALTGTPWTSEHIGFSVADTDLDGALITQATSDLLPYEVALANIIRNGRALAAHLTVPLLLENIPLFPNLAHLHVCEPAFVSQVIAETGCGLLLDLAHARVTSDVLGYDVHDYILALPLDRVEEIHLSGPRPVAQVDPRRQALVRENARSIQHLVSFTDDNLIDAHETLQEEDYALLTWTLERCQPLAVSLEYFRDPILLGQQLLRLREITGTGWKK